jgi:hypothetical protein
MVLSKHGPRSGLGFALAALGAATALAGCGGSDSGAATKASSTSSSTPSAAATPDYGFFQGKTITYVVSNSPGSGQSQPIVAMKPALEQKLHATINITYNQAFTTVGQNIVGHSKPDGLTIGGAGISTDILNMGSDSKSGQLTFPFQSANFLGGTVISDFVAVACKGSPFTSIDQVVAGQTKATTLAIKGAATGLYTHLFLNAYPSVPHKYTYYSSAVTQAAGCARGDGNFTILPLAGVLNTSGTAFTPGIKPLLLMAPVSAGVPGGFLNGKVPTLADYAKSQAPATPDGQKAINLLIEDFGANAPQFASFAPPGVPAERVAALVDAFTYAAQQPQVVKQLLATGNPKGWIKPDDIVSYLKTEIPLAKYMNSLSD